MRDRWISLAALAALMLVPTAGAQSETQHWIGFIQIPDPARPELLFIVELTRDDAGEWSGQLDIPLQGQLADQGIEVRDIEIKPNVIRFLDPAPPMDNLYEFLLDGTGQHGGGRMMLGGQQQLSARIHRVSEAEAATARTPRPMAESAGPAPVSREGSFANSTDGTRIGGTLTLPLNATGPAPAVLLLSGSGRHDRDQLIGFHRTFGVLADRLARAGFATLRVDDRGVGASNGTYEQCSITELAGDARAGLAFLRSQGEVDPAKVGVLGVSEGATVGARLSATGGAETGPAFCVMISPVAMTGNEMLALQERQRLEAEGEEPAYIDARLAARAAAFELILAGAETAEIEEALLEGIRVMHKAKRGDGFPMDEDQMRTRVGGQIAAFEEPRYRWWLAHDPIPDFERMACPTLALWGGLDQVVSPEPNKAALAQAVASAPASADAVLRIFDNCNHLLQPSLSGADREYAMIAESIDPEALEEIISWLQKETE